MTTDPARQAVFLSVAEGQKVSLARRFRDLLGPSVEGFIVSDLPLIGDAYTPEEKVDAYLERSHAVVVFATADLEADTGQFTRPNIADEIGRARSKAHLRNRICVLKQSGVTLPSNTNPAYNHLDPNDPEPAFAAALEQLKSWGFDLLVPAATSARPAGVSGRPGASNAASSDPSPEDQAAALQRAISLVPQPRNTVSEPALVLVAVALPKRSLLRPAELEDPALAAWLEREALYGEPPVLERGEGTKTGVRGSSLVVQQSRAWVAIDEEGTVVIMRALTRGTDRSVTLRGIIEEEVLADLEADLVFVDRVLDHVDRAGAATHVVLVVALSGTGYTAWRTRAEQAASPNSMTLNMSGREQIVTNLSRPAQPRSALSDNRVALAGDLMVLLRREARKS